MTKILITAFEPFGLIGSWLRGANASQQILSNIQEKQDCIPLTLPVSQKGIDTFLETLDQHKPDGLISLGEHMFLPPSQIVTEPYAYDTKTTALPLKCLFSDKVESPFIKEQHPDNTKSMIGGYYCNQLYLQGLKWSQNNGNIPVAFIHVPVLGNQGKHTQKITDMMRHMKSSIENTHDCAL